MANGRYAGTTSTIVAITTLNPSRSPNTVGSYTGQVCWTASSPATL